VSDHEEQPAVVEAEGERASFVPSGPAPVESWKHRVWNLLTDNYVRLAIWILALSELAIAVKEIAFWILYRR
jgi:hypothetical protein